MFSQRQRKRIKDKLVGKIDKKDELQIEKVERYMNLLDMYYTLDGILGEQGNVISIKNGNQVYQKVNPLIAEKNKINSQLIALEKTFVFKEEEKEKLRLI